MSSLSIFAQTGREYFKTYQEIKYPNGKIKEQADWKDGLIIGKRKFFNDKGVLIEEHRFSEDSVEFKDGKPYKGIGTLKTYYQSGSVASVVPIYEMLRQVRADFEYELKVDYDLDLKGYFENGKLAYIFKMERPLVLNGSRNQNYSKMNMFYPDALLLNKEINQEGLDAEITLYHDDGTLLGKGKMHNGKKVGYWKLLNSSSIVESEGEFLEKGLDIEYKTGIWKYYNESGTLIKEVEYYKVGGGKNFKYGDFVNLSKFYDEKGILMSIIQYPSVSDINFYVDTVELYHSNGQLNFKYNDVDKIEMFNGMPYNFSGKFDSYYSNGNLKETGYLSKIPRGGASEYEININECIMKPTKKIGRWYYFNEDGKMIKIIEYDFCGNVKQELATNKVDKENTKYQLQKNSYTFDYVVKL
ncbi:MAG: hypothetical protein A2033_06965 [Bacteroidetes bacterium GWA2_31_9]|nr:MAG: hypothetical protein A2033_06965 [Bacteroidetes bacterium GWA2_31_9]